MILLFAAIAPSQAGTEHYDYDPLGRLNRYIDAGGNVTEYIYDAVGNILEVRRGDASSVAPSIAGIDPAELRRGETKSIRISGSGFSGVSVQVSGSGLSVSNLQVSATLVSFALTASAATALGAQPIRLSNALGSATATITVNPGLPTVFVDPTPLAIPPDNVSRQITVRLSNTDTIAHTLTLSMSNANATISPLSVTIAAGQTSALAAVRGVSAGQSTLTLSSVTLGNTLVPVFITGEFAGLNTSLSAPLGVVLEGGAPPSPTQITPLASKVVGVVVGSFIRGLAPTNFTPGSGPTTLTISGVGLQAAQSVAVNPATGITLGAISVAPDGTSISLPVTVDANSPISQRKVVVTGPAGAFPAASPDADRINIVRAVPEILSIDPLFSTQGTLIGLAVRGRNLNDAISVSFNPSNGITVGTSPAVSADGTALTTTVSIGGNAPVGAKTVIVTTPGGSSSSTPSPANTFSVVNQAVQTVTPVISRAIGVVLQDGTTPAGLPTTLFAPALGVSVGSVVTSISPAVGVIGETISVTLQGASLQGVSAIQFAPATGLTVGALTVAPDGKSVTFPVTVALDASQTVRAVKVMSGAALVPFASADAALFRVSAMLPAVDSVTPVIVQSGQPPIAFAIRGRNFQNAQLVRVVPPDGLGISPPTVSADGTEIDVMLSAAANAVPGPRVVIVVVPAGESSSIPAPQNTFILTSTQGTSFTPITSALLGVVKQDSTPPPSTEVGPIVAPALGVVLQNANPPPTVTQSLFARSVGVAIGPVAKSIAPTAFAPNSSGTLTVQGFGLNGITAVTVNPSSGVTLGTPTIAPDGTQIVTPIAVAADASATIREVRLQSAAGSVPFADPAASRFTIGVGVPQFDSITPILSAQGTTFTMTIRGSNLSGATAVSATPPDGIAISNTLTINPLGTQLDVIMSLAPNAPLGSRVIQVLVPGAASSASPTPANTFTVISQ